MLQLVKTNAEATETISPAFKPLRSVQLCGQTFNFNALSHHALESCLKRVQNMIRNPVRNAVVTELLKNENTGIPLPKSLTGKPIKSIKAKNFP